MQAGGDGGVGPGRVLRTFLIADIRGYSTFVEQRGIEDTAALAGRFVDIAGKTVAEHDGVLSGVRGDQVLAAFESAESALTAALEMQRRLLLVTRADRSLPLPVGIGLDASEAVLVDGEWSATAINVAARLCAKALGGEVLATSDVVDSVGLPPGVRAVAWHARPLRGSTELAGIARPVRIVRVTAAGVDSVGELRRMGFARAAAPARRSRRRFVAAGVAALVLGGAAVAAAVDDRNDDGPRASGLLSNSIGAFSTTTGTRVADVRAVDAPTAVTADRGAVWVASASSGTVTRVAATRRGEPVVRVHVGQQPSAVAVGYGAVWVTDAATRSVSRIDDVARPTVTDTVPVGGAPGAVTVGHGRVWVANELDGTVSVLDPSASGTGARDRVVATIAVGSQPDAIVDDGQGVWVALGATADVVRIDPSSLRVGVSVGVGNGPDALAVARDGLWVANGIDGTVSHIDTRSVSVDRTVRVGRSPDALGVVGAEVWVGDRDSDDLRQLDRAGGVRRTVALGRSPVGLAADRGRLWVAVGQASSAHRGGTLRVVGSGDLHTLDPAHAYSQFAWNVESVLHDGLVTFQRTAGPSGGVVVPDLAVRLPRISQDGRSYTFQLRRGLHYSDGQPVRASDVRASFERLLLSRDAPPYYGGIVGAAGCAPARRACDLSRGVIADDSSGIVQIRLTAADSSLLEKLAVPFASILPARTPTTDLGLTRRPVTGPYEILSVTRTAITLVRNPRFVPWSDAAQPPGRPDRIVVTYAPAPGRAGDPADEARATLLGRYDWSADAIAPQQLAGLLRTRTAQLRQLADGSVHYFFLNTGQAPFTDLRVRQAVNLAVDRRAALQAFGGRSSGATTCQVLPPTLPGYRPFCPYTAKPDGSGTWNGPDLRPARELVRQAHAVGAKVVVFTPSDRAAVGRVLVRALTAIGMRARAVAFRGSEQDYYTYVLTPSHHVQTGLEAWVPDYPSPSNVFGPLLRCDSRTRINNLDESLFCDRRIDREMDAIDAVEVTDPTAAGARWAGVDRAITTQAPWVPLTNGVVYNAVSRRLGNFEAHPEYGMVLDQAWVV